MKALQKQWLLIVVLAGILVGTAVLLAQNAQAQPVEVADTRSGATVSMFVSRDRQIFPAQCAYVRWELEGIRAVYLNGEGKVGAGEQEACTVSGIITLDVEFTDDTSHTYTVPQVPLYHQPAILLSWAITLLCAGYGLWRLFGARGPLLLATLVIFAPMMRNNVNLLSDFVGHTMFAKIALEDPNALPPHFLYQATLIALHQTSGLSLENAAFVTVMLSYLLAALLTFGLLRWLSRQGAHDVVIAVLTLGILLIGPIRLGFKPVDDPFGVAMISPNVTHNPTILYLKPWALLLFWGVVALWERMRRPSILQMIGIALLVILGTMTKPNYTLAFVPALVLLVMVRALRLRERHPLWLAVSVVLPATLLLGWQYLFYFTPEGTSTLQSADQSVQIAPFVLHLEMWGVPLWWLPIAIFLSVVFPLAAAALFPRRTFSSLPLQLAWLTFALALAQGFLFIEYPLPGNANFTWGAQSALYILIVTSAGLLLRGAGPPLVRDWRLWACWGAFGAQLLDRLLALLRA